MEKGRGQWEAKKLQNYRMNGAVSNQLMTSEGGESVRGQERLERGGSCWLSKLDEWGLKEYKWKGSFPGWFVRHVVPVQDIFVLLDCSSRPDTTYFFSTVHYFNAFVPIAQQAGQAAVLGRLYLNMCLCWGSASVDDVWQMGFPVLCTQHSVSP